MNAKVEHNVTCLPCDPIVQWPWYLHGLRGGPRFESRSVHVMIPPL